MKPLRNYFGQSELNHTFSKALKRKASDEFSEIVSNYQKLYSDVRKIDIKYDKIPTSEQIELLISQFISNELKNSFVSTTVL